MLLNIQYIGEHLMPGKLGSALLFIALFTAFVSSILYFISENKNNPKLKIIARITYNLHFIALLSAGGILFHILLNGYYEYDYVWKHTASYLPLKFIISAFWAGQEGSFLLWLIIQATLGFILTITAKHFESRVMTIISAGQFFLTTMILGIKPLGLVLGKSPFALMRTDAVNAGAEFFQNPNYLASIVDGNGINPLLENIWMVTHPPLLFLGYAVAIIPFAYAMASLWKGDFRTWLKPAFPWMIFAVISLGGGIMLGGAWAYESLTFGGFWAWDPVENASLIPWLILLAAMHIMILNKKRNHSYILGYILVSLGFVLVIYASYLTRSGVLGETSAHAFGNNGLSTQMIVIMLSIIALSAFLIIKNIKKMPKDNNDNILSREFWILMAAIVLILSAAQVFFSTSIPVFNAIFGTQLAPPENRELYYNQWQLPFAANTLILLSISLVLSYGKNKFKTFIRSYLYLIIASVILFIIGVYFFNISSISYLALFFTAILALVSSSYFLISNKIGAYNLGNSFSHIGFAIFIAGVLIAFSNSDIITSNTSKFDLGDATMNKENQLLIKDELKMLNGYWVSYDSLQREKNHLYYYLSFYKMDKDSNLVKAFNITPSINVNERMGNVYDPYTHHSFSKDVFTYVTYADISADLDENQFSKVIKKEIIISDTITTTEAKFVLENIRIEKNAEELDINNVSIIAELRPIVDGKRRKKFDLTYSIKNGIINKEEKFLEDYQLLFNFDNISSQKKGIIIGIKKKNMKFVVIKTMVFPFISIMWLGVFITLIGLGISLFRNIWK